MADRRSGRARHETRAVVVATGCVGVLALTSMALAASVNRLDTLTYLLMRDLGRVAFLLWGGLTLWAALASAAVTVERAGLPLGHLLTGAPWSSTARRVWTTLVAVTVAAILLPHILPASGSGLSLRVGLAGPPSADAPPTRIAGPAIDESVRDGAVRPLHGAIAGWVFMPWTGAYHFTLSVQGDARLEIDGAVVPCGGRPEAADPAYYLADVTEVRCAPANLLKGFRRIAIVYRQPAGDAHPLLRWTPPNLTGSRAIPAYYLLPDDAEPAARRQRTLILVGQRAGLLAVTLLVVLRLAGLTLRRGDARGWTGGRVHPGSPASG